MEKPRVLVVDDNHAMRTILSRFIELAGGEALAVADGETAISEVNKAKMVGKAFLLILMDIRMPTMNGMETTKCLRDAGFSGFIAACTAASTAGDRKKSQEAGIDAYFDKSVVNEQVMHALIQRALELKNLS